mmetsp:Transcript_18874/g.40825  ORF Transcript_18874/g.40825 Transcript_18874/m.40825 type:complete len:429 (-) Transcript_18874:47-1333(-)
MRPSSSSSSSSSCSPPKGSTYLTIGQDLFSIEEYVLSQYNASLHSKSPKSVQSFYPSSFMVYTDLEKLRGLSSPVDYGSGVEYADGVLDSVFAGYTDGIGIQIGLWLGGSKGCRKINSGKLDDQIEALIDYLNGCGAHRVLLRVGYEFDNPSFGYSDAPDAYVKAYRRIVGAIRKSPSKSKCKFVWHSWAAPKVASLQSFWPGDAYVDWIGISIFQQLYPWAQNDSSFAGGRLSDVEEVLAFAKEHGKATMIAESTPFGGIDMRTNETIAFDMEDPWDRWFEPVLDLIDKWDIGLWSYINCDWESQPMWHDVGFGESRISSDARVMKKWQDVVLGGHGARTFLMAGSMKNCGHEKRTYGRIFDARASLLPGMGVSTWAASPSLMDYGATIAILLSLFVFVKRRRPYGSIDVSAQNGQRRAGEATPILS